MSNLNNNTKNNMNYLNNYNKNKRLNNHTVCISNSNTNINRKINSNKNENKSININQPQQKLLRAQTQKPPFHPQTTIYITKQNQAYNNYSQLYLNQKKKYPDYFINKFYYL